MDATQNHYGSFGYYSPMVFLGRKRYLKDTFLFPVLQQLAWGRHYADMLFVTDSPEKIVEFIKRHPPVKATSGISNYKLNFRQVYHLPRLSPGDQSPVSTLRR